MKFSFSKYVWFDGKFVPTSVAEIISENWETVKKFASMEDLTIRIAGMKFPKEGYDSK